MLYGMYFTFIERKQKPNQHTHTTFKSQVFQAMASQNNRPFA